MLKRTWPYGTTLQVEVERYEVARLKGEDIGVLLVITTADRDNPEAHILLDTPEALGRPQAGDRGTITFCQGGPIGGYWRYAKRP